MARIPVSEIPNAPGLVGPPANVRYPGAPNVQFANQPYQTGRVAPMQNIANYTKDIAGLQQAPLPSGFAEGQARVVSALGQTAHYAGDATREFGRQVSSALNAVGSVLSDAHQKALQSKDAVDMIRFQSDMANAPEAFKQKMLEENVPVEQWAERWQKEGAQQFMQTASLYGVTRGTKEQIMARATGFVEGQTITLGLGVAQKVHKDNYDFLVATGEEAARKGDAAGMRTAYNELYAQHYINEGAFKLKMGEADRVEHQSVVDFVKQRNPQELVDQGMAAREGKATGEFKFLNEDPALANKTLYEANQEVNRRQQEVLVGFSDQIIRRDEKLTDDEIEAKGRAAGLHEGDIEQLKKQNKTDVAYNDRAVADANAAVVTYDALNDVDPKTKLPSMKRYKEILDQINTTVPKEMRAPLISELNKSYREGVAGKPKDGRQVEVAEAMTRLKQYRDAGILIDPTTQKPLPSGIKGEGEKRKIDTAAVAAADKQYIIIQRQLQEYVDGNPQFGVGEVIDKLNDLTSVHKEAAATSGANYREQQAKEAEVRRATMHEGPYTIHRLPPAREAAPPRSEWEKKVNAPPVPSAPTNYPGQVEAGNIDLTKRPVVKNPDGTISTELSFSISDEKGREVLIPQVVGGKILSQKEAVEHYHKTGEHLGIFKDVESANAAAEKIHNRVQPTTSAAAPTRSGNFVLVSNVLGGRLAGKEDAFQAAGEKYGVDPALLMAIAQHETGRGSSEAVRDKNNPGGMMDPETDWSEIKKFASLDEGIDAMARNLKEKYVDQGLTTIKQIQAKYAPINAKNDPQGKNKDWVPGVTKFYEEIKGNQQQQVKLDPRSTGQIATLQATVQTMATDFLSRAKAWAHSKGLDVVVTEGLRSLERQRELYAQGRTKPGDIVTNAKPGQSNHGSGRAFDVAITRNGKPVDQKDLWNELGKIGKSAGFRWGGDFRSIYDPEHFEFAG
jgi:hypothetical protein